MPIRRNVEDALTRVLMEKRGLRFHFSFGEPVVHDAQNNPVDPRIYVETRELADELYRAVIGRIDFNRLTLEASSAWLVVYEDAVTRKHKVYNDEQFGESASRTGRAIKAALVADDTFPDWRSVLSGEEMKW